MQKRQGDSDSPVGPNPGDHFGLVRLDPPRLAIATYKGVGHPFTVMPDQGMDLLSRPLLLQIAAPHEVRRAAGGTDFRTAGYDRPGGKLDVLPAIWDSLRSVSARSSVGRPRGGAVPISFASSVEPSLRPSVTGFPPLLSPQIEAGDGEAQHTTTGAECNGDAHPREQYPREDVWRCQDHQRADEEPPPPGERCFPRRFHWEAKESYRDSERPRRHLMRIAPTRPELEPKARHIAL